MLIKHIRIKNFRSFEELDIELSNFNVLIGANASGKSNFISIFNFLRNLIDYGIEDAISLSGGIEYLKNLYQSKSNLVSIEISMELGESSRGYTLYNIDENSALSYDTKSFEYKLEIKIQEDNKYEVVNELLLLNVEFRLVDVEYGEDYEEESYDDFNDDELEELEGEYIGRGQFKISKIKDKVKSDLKVIESEMEEDQIKEILLPEWDLKKVTIKRKGSIFQILPYHTIDLYDVEYALNSISSYNINPLPMKQFSTIAGKSELEPDGKNLILILKRILSDDKDGIKFSEIINDLLPFIEKISVEKLANKYIYATIKEIYSKEKVIPSFLISDGTINLIALVIILFFEENPIVIIEEPERNIHPYLISKVIDLMKDVSSRLGKQVIITTHNPEIVKYSGIDNLLLIRRDNKGFSSIFKPIMSEEVKNFLKNDMGLDELFIQNLLK